MAHLYSNINYVYNKLGFSEKYGGSLLITIILLIVFFLAISYFQVMIKSKEIKDDWVNKRCDPGVMPFAGIINKPNDQSAFQFTADNFSYCSQNAIKQVTGFFLLPIEAALKLVQSFMNVLFEMLNSVRNMMNQVRTDAKNIMEEIFGRILGVLIPLQTMFISIIDVMGKVQGTMTATLYTAYGGYQTLSSAVGASYQFIVMILIALAIMIIALWIVPFTWGMAAAMTVLFLAVAIPLAIVGVVLQETFHLSIPGIPSAPKKPSCFDGNTIIKTKNGVSCIKNLDPGTILKNGDKVTAVLRLSAFHEDMYNLDGITVSGSHIVNLYTKWIPVCEHPNAIHIPYDSPFIYCLCTESKTIRVRNHTFVDWNEIPEMDIPQSEYECGFHENTTVETITGKKCIKDLKIYDELPDNNYVLGIVKIDATAVPTYKYLVKGKTFVAGPSFHVKVESDTFANQSKFEKLSCPTETLYHVITEKGNIIINNSVFLDYNTNIYKLL